MKPSKLKDFLATAARNRFPVLLTGAPGVGKTDLITQVAATTDSDLIFMHPAVSDPTDFKGMPALAEGGAEFLPFGDLKQLVTANRPTVVCPDDIGQAPMAVQAALMQLFLARRIGEHKVSDYVTFIGATNRREDRAGVSGLLEPVKSRFMSIVAFDPDLDDWCRWGLNNSLPHDLISFVRYRPHLLLDPNPSHELVNTPSPRTITNLGRWVNAGVEDMEVLGGATGEGFAAEYLAFRKIWRSLPDISMILADPERADVPTDVAVLYAMSGALTARATKENGDAMFRYIRRLPPEFQVLITKDMASSSSPAIQTQAFAAWARDNHNDNFGR